MDDDDYARHFLEGKTIVVAGGGIAGAAFAAGLRKQWDPALKPPRIIIFDRDSQDVAAQREGYSLSLAGTDSTGGLAALKKLDLLDQTLASAVSGLDGCGSFKIWGADWREYVSLRRKPMPGIATPSIRIARKDLRRVLHGAADVEGMIQWESQCVSARQCGNGRVAVRVLQGDNERVLEQECDLLVAADGASSKLRSFFRSNDTLEYAGAVLRGGLSRFDGPLPKPIDKDWGFMLSGTGVSCFLSPVDEHSVVWAVGHLEDDQVPPLNRNSPAEVQAVIDQSLELGSLFQEPFRTIATRIDPSTIMCLNAKDKMPFRHDAASLETLPVVFIGDSNHAVSPFAGYGANLAICDGWDLAENLCKKGSLKSAVAGYDEASVPRAARIVQSSRKRLKMGHSTGWRYWIFLAMMMLARIVSFVLGKR